MTDTPPIKSCASCLYSVLQRVDKTQIKPQLFCYRLPPTGLMAMTPQGLALASVHPVVQEKDWCWEHVPHGSANLEKPVAEG